MSNKEEIGNIREFLKRFREECGNLFVFTQTFDALFDESKETKELLENSASWFFHDLNKIFVEYFILQVCRLTDPAESRVKNVHVPNFTYNRLNQMLKKIDLLSPEITEISKKLERYRDKLIDARNKLIAHLDEDSFLNSRVFGKHLKTDLEDFLRNLNDYCDAVAATLMHHLDPDYERGGIVKKDLADLQALDLRPGGAKGDAQSLIRALEERQGWKNLYDQGRIPNWREGYS